MEFIVNFLSINIVESAYLVESVCLDLLIPLRVLLLGQKSKLVGQISYAIKLDHKLVICHLTMLVENSRIR